MYLTEKSNVKLRKEKVTMDKILKHIIARQPTMKF